SGPARLTASIEGGSFDTFNQWAGLSGSAEQFHYSAHIEHLHAGATPVTPLNLLLPGETRNDDYYDNLTASTKLGYDVTRDLDVGLSARYTDTHLRFTGDDFSDFPAPSFPAAEQSGSNTSEYYARAFAHLMLFEGSLEQTLGLAYMRNRTANLEPQFPPGLNTGERIKLDWQGTVKLSADQTLLRGAGHERGPISQPLS